MKLKFRLLIFAETLLLLILLGASNNAYATHNRAGEIIYEQIGSLRIRATIITYTKASSVDADRDSVLIEWGDGTRQYVARSNGNGEGVPIGNNTRFNLYIAEHTYPSATRYTISMTDPNRNGGILNVNPPNSENIPFHIETTFTLLNSQFQGFNSSPKLLQPPIDIGCVGQVFIHNPNAFDDKDLDSLAYELIIPKQFVDTDVPNYFFPDQISPGSDNKISLNPVTGDFVWDAPQKAGEYNIAILIKEYRQGILINTMIRDMQILILDNCNNTPPKINTITDTCIVAGQLLEFDVIGTDIDIPLQKIKLTATGGPFEIISGPAIFNAPANYSDQPVVGRFSWIPPCDAINSQYYNVIFKAVDDKFSMNDTLSGLADLKTVRIKVIGPAPEHLEAVAQADQINLSWDYPYACQETTNNYFQGFNVWRRISSASFLVDTCNPSMNGKGYDRIAFSQKNFKDGKYIFEDKNVEKGKAYCYRIEAIFAKQTAGGFPFNQVASLPSNEACAQQRVDICLITNVSVQSTDANGSILIKWARPLPQNFDTLLYPGPYVYKLKRSNGMGNNNFIDLPAASRNSNHFLQNLDTTFIDTGINTSDQSYEYRVDIYYGSEQVLQGVATSASSVFLTAKGIDKRVELTWKETVPFSNYKYAIFRKNVSGLFDSIGFTTDKKFIDFNKINGENYCYKIKAFGTYNLTYLPPILVNFSQEVCAIPVDSVAPCAPILTVTNKCNEPMPTEENINHLQWNFHDANCDLNDVFGFIVYYQVDNNAGKIEIAKIDDPNSRDYFHISDEFGLAGCYTVEAYDSVGNVSSKGNQVCMENCPIYNLPNTFTPNSDGKNDLFIPYPYQFIQKVDFKVFNRWGNQIFQTFDPDINWDGKNNLGKTLPDGTYYYTCKVYTRSPVSQQETLIEQLSGYIELIR